MQRARLIEILMIAGLAMGLLAILFPGGLMILLFLTLGNGLIVVGFGIYLGIVWSDLKRHKVL